MNPILLAVFVAVMAAVPYAALGERRRRYAVFDAGSYALLVILWWVAPALGLPLEGSLTFSLLVVTKVAVFVSFLAAEKSVEGWNENWAALFAAAIYLILVPHELRWPIDGDEPYYLLVTESLVQDRDLDLRNQYADISRSATRRPDLRPQIGDPVGRRGEQYSRTEVFLSLLVIPGFLLFGLHGAVATVTIFGALLVRSTLRLLKEEGVSDRTARICFAFLFFGPPVVFYATRIWPEVPAAFFLVESLRAVRARRPLGFVLSILGLSLLKLRFVLIAIPMLLFFVLRGRWTWRTATLGTLLISVPLLVAFVITGQWLNVHAFSEFQPQAAWKYARGALGLLFDAQAGLLFQAPFFFLGMVALVRWGETPESARIGIAAAALYLILLFPRDEWHGGWSPPLRYLVVLIPVLCLAAAAVVERLSSPALIVLGIASAASTIHGIAFPWRLFHIANGESVLGEWLSRYSHWDFSRLLPSFIRPNRAAVLVAMIVAIGFALAALIASTRLRVALPAAFIIGLSSVILAAGYRVAKTPGSLVHLEDSHVQHRGGELYPHEWTVGRFLYTGGWRLRAGDEMMFRYRGGRSYLFYLASSGAQVEIDGKGLTLPQTSSGFRAIVLTLPDSASHAIRAISGEVIFDRIEQR